MQLYFVTSNQVKLDEAAAFFPEIKSMDINLEEIQSLDPIQVLIPKLKAIKDSKEFLFSRAYYFVDDFCCGLECQNGFPGTFVKWFEESFSKSDYGANEYNLICKAHNNFNATITISIGLSDNYQLVKIFSHELKGTIVEPRPGVGKGIYTVFIPNRSDKTLSQMTAKERNAVSPRGICFQKIKEFLSSEKNLQT
jgi:non-canonical purine NTP pyrophosphatase (RdgB/HAM1 family)